MLVGIRHSSAKLVDCKADIRAARVHKENKTADEFLVVLFERFLCSFPLVFRCRTIRFAPFVRRANRDRSNVVVTLYTLLSIVYGDLVRCGE